MTGEGYLNSAIERELLGEFAVALGRGQPTGKFRLDIRRAVRLLVEALVVPHFQITMLRMLVRRRFRFSQES